MSTTRPTIKKSLARRIGRIAATLTLLASTTAALGIAVTAAPSGAVGSCGSQPFYVGADQWVLRGTFPVGNYGLGFRDVAVFTSCGAPGGHVWYGVKDTTTGVWYGGWAYADQTGNLRASITGIPASSCGHRFVADASDWGEPGAPAAPEFTFMDDCTPQVMMDANGYISGNGFTPGAKYSVSVTIYHDVSVVFLPPTTVIASTFRLNPFPYLPTPQGNISLPTTIRASATPKDCLITVLDKNGAGVTGNRAYC